MQNDQNENSENQSEQAINNIFEQDSVEQMTVEDLVTVINDQNQSKDAKTACLIEFQKRKIDKDSVPEKIIQEQNIATAINTTAALQQEVFHKQVLEFGQETLTRFLQILNKNSYRQQVVPANDQNQQNLDRQHDPLNLTNNILLTFNMPTAMPRQQQFCINASYQTLNQIANIEQPERQKKQNDELQERKRAGQQIFEESKWEQHRTDNFMGYLHKKGPIPLTKAFISKDLTQTVRNFFSLSQLCAQKKAYILKLSQEKAEQVFNFDENEQQNREKELQFVVLQNQISNVFTDQDKESQKFASENNNFRICCQKIDKNFIKNMEKQFGLNGDPFDEGKIYQQANENQGELQIQSQNQMQRKTQNQKRQGEK